MVDIAAPPHVATRSLNDIAVQFSIAVVVATKVGHSKYLDDTHVAIADLARCGGISRSEADVQERNNLDHEHGGCNGLCPIGWLAV